jgi:hypothetical protein
VKNVFVDLTPCGFIIKRRFGGTCLLHLQGSKHLTLFLARVICSTLKMKATRSSETSDYDKPTRCHIPEDDILQVQMLVLCLEEDYLIPYIYI